MRDAARGEDGAGRDRQGVTGRGGERAGGRVGDREATQGPVGSDVVHRVAGTDLQDITGGAGRDVGDGGVTGEGRDAVGRIISAEVRPGDEEAGDQAGRAARAEDIRELELIVHRQARRGRDVERAARVGEGRVVERRECQDVRASAGEIDDGITVGAEHGHRLGRVRSVADHVQATAFEVDRAAGETTGRVVGGDVVEREDAARADDRAVTGGREDRVQGASRAADRHGAAFDNQIAREGISRREIQLRAGCSTEIKAAGRGAAAAIPEDARDVRHTRTDEKKNACIAVVRQVDSVRQVEHRPARQHVVQGAVAVVVRERTGEREAISTGDGRVIAGQEDRIRDRVGAGKVEASLEDTPVEVKLAGRQGRDGCGDRRAPRGSGADRDRTGRDADDGGARWNAGARDRLADLETGGRGDARKHRAAGHRGDRERRGRDAARTEGADLVQEDTALGERREASIGVRRSAAEGQRGVVGHRDIEGRVATDAGVTADDAVPDGRACSADIESRRLRGGRGGRVDVITGDGEDLAVLEVVREGGVVIA